MSSGRVRAGNVQTKIIGSQKWTRLTASLAAFALLVGGVVLGQDFVVPRAEAATPVGTWDQFVSALSQLQKSMQSVSAVIAEQAARREVI